MSNFSVEAVGEVVLDGADGGRVQCLVDVHLTVQAESINGKLVDICTYYSVFNNHSL